MEQRAERHPSALTVFFMTEMWERYGFYVVQTLLVLYLVGQFQWPDRVVYTLVGSFTALTYISPIFGGMIADHYLGQKRCVVLGAFCLGVSYSLLALFPSERGLYCALSGIVMGTGLLKSNISSLLGHVYARDSLLRERGFTIFYMGITAGIILGTTFPSLLFRYFGWPISFLSASLGLALALFVFVWGCRKFHIQDYEAHRIKLSSFCAALLLMLGMGFWSFKVLSHPMWANVSFLMTVILSLGYLGYCWYADGPKYRLSLYAIALFCVISAIFWTFYFQMFLSLTLFITRVVSPRWGGCLFPAPYYVAIQSLGVIVMGWWVSRPRPSHTVAVRAAYKFLNAILITWLAFTWLAMMAHWNLEHTGALSVGVIVPTYLALSLAELYLSPVGLNVMTLLAPSKRVSTIMGIFFVSLGIGGFLAGKLANITAVPSHDIDLIAFKLIYAKGYVRIWILMTAALCFSVMLSFIIRTLLTVSLKRNAS